MEFNIEERLSSCAAVAIPIAAILLSACSTSPAPLSLTTTSLASTGSGLQINPTVETISPSNQFQFSATGGTPPYQFSVVSGEGTIDSSSGIYTAPGTAGSAQVEVTDATGSVSYATVTVGGSGTSASLALTPDNQAIAPGEPLQFNVSGGTGPYTFAVVQGGGTINAQTGLYTAPSYASTVEVQVKDSSTPTQQIAFATINVGNTGNTGTASGSTTPSTIFPMGAAASNDIYAGWLPSYATDGNPSTAYSSTPFPSSTNGRGTYLAAWLQSGPQNVAFVIITARMSNGKALGFPQTYDIDLTAPDNSSWVPIGTFSTQPDPSTGEAIVALPNAYSTYGVMVTPETLGMDDVGNYIFQVAEISLAH